MVSLRLYARARSVSSVEIPFGTDLARLLRFQILKKLGGRIDPRHKKVFPCPRARHVEQVPLRAIGFLELGFFRYSLDAGLQRQNLIVARHYGHGPELEPLRHMHRRDGHVISSPLQPLIEDRA